MKQKFYVLKAKQLTHMLEILYTGTVTLHSSLVDYKVDSTNNFLCLTLSVF